MPETLAIPYTGLFSCSLLIASRLYQLGAERFRSTCAHRISSNRKWVNVYAACGLRLRGE